MTVYVDNVPHSLPTGSSVRDAEKALSPFGNEPVIVMVNGAHADSDEILAEGDFLGFFPLLIGG